MKNTSSCLDSGKYCACWLRLLFISILLLPIQLCRLNQNSLIHAASLNLHGQSETNRLNLSDQESSGKLLPKLSNQKSAFPDPQLEKAEVIQKTRKLQIPFIANNGQTDERVKFYANTFGGTVFVTKDGEIVYALPKSGKEEDRGQGLENRGKKPEARDGKQEVEVKGSRGEKEKTEASGRASVPLVDSGCRLDEAFDSPLKRGAGGCVRTQPKT